MAVVSVWLALGSGAAAAKDSTAIYSNPRFGISFQYPRSYQVLMGDDAKLDWGYLGSVAMNFIRPDGITVAALRLPDNSYPGTDFNLGFFRVNVDLRLDASARGLFANTQPDQPAFPAIASRVRVGANEFAEGEEEEAGMQKQAQSWNYHIFRNEICYEFQLGLGTAGLGAVDGLRPVDRDAVIRKLEAILATVKIDQVKVAGAIAPPASISLDLTPVTSARPMTYRVSWSAPAQPLSSPRLRIRCDNSELKVWRSSVGGDKETELACGNAIPLPSNSGSLLIRFKASASVQPQIAFIAQANLSTTRTIELPPSPSIEEVFAGDCEWIRAPR